MMHNKCNGSTKQLKPVWPTFKAVYFPLRLFAWQKQYPMIEIRQSIRENWKKFLNSKLF